MMEWLNNNAGLISLIGTLAAVVAAFAAIAVPIAIERKHSKEELLSMLDEDAAMDKLGPVPMNMESKQHIADMMVLKSKISRRMKR